MSLFARQFLALFRKNWIVLSKHPYLNILRCFLLPIGYGIFLALAQHFLTKPDNLGLGTVVQIPPLAEAFTSGFKLIWADVTNGTTSPAPAAVMARITRDFTPAQLAAVHQVASSDDIAAACPQNFQLYSECYSAIAFNSGPSTDNLSIPLNYTLRGDAGFFFIDVQKHAGDFEKRILPLQWAVDSAIIELQTGVSLPQMQEWPFTQESNAQQSLNTRLSFVRGIRSLLVLALYISFLGIVYQLPGSFMTERANLLTSHMQAMGLLNSARITSWHLSLALAYLPAWVIVSLTWHAQIFTATNAGIILIVHLLAGLSLTSWSLFAAVPFGKSPQLAAVCTTFLAVFFAIIAQVLKLHTGGALLFCLIFPPGYYIYVIRAICGWENLQEASRILQPDPDNQLRILPLMIIALIDIFLYPALAVWWEHYLYDAREPGSSFWSCFRSRRRKVEDGTPPIGPDTAISIRNLNKQFKTSMFRSKESVTAISDLSFDIPKGGIFVLLGSNGAGKSTALSIIGGLLSRTKGAVIFEGGTTRPNRGSLGIVPQKNVLFAELSCYQTVRLWSAIKRPAGASESKEDLEQLLKDCDLGHKIYSNSNTLSGGQKRKLQLAIGLVGGSKLVLVDECTSGVDPLSRRAIWRTLISVRLERTIVFTTHFLDEADLLGDNVAILAAPGKLVAAGTPVSLKSSLGDGYVLHVSFTHHTSGEKDVQTLSTELLEQIKDIVPTTTQSQSATAHVGYHLKTKDSRVVSQVLRFLETEGKAHYKVAYYDAVGTTLVDIFLNLMRQEEPIEDMSEKSVVEGQDSPIPALMSKEALRLTDGKRTSPLSHAMTIFRKRCLVARRSWLTPLMTIIIAICGACIPLFFMDHEKRTCLPRTIDRDPTLIASVPLFLPGSPFGLFAEMADPESIPVVSPPNLLETLGPRFAGLSEINEPDHVSFLNEISDNYRNLSLGGIALDLIGGNSLIAWEASTGTSGPTLINLASNILLNHALNTTGRPQSPPALIIPTYSPFSSVGGGPLNPLKWIAFYGAAMGAFPAFFTLYVSRERRSSVQAMQYSNGITNPAGLWLGHLMFEGIIGTIIATVVTIIFATASNQFHGLGYMWIVHFLYGFAGALFAYCVTLFTPSPLAAFATVAAYQVLMFMLYVAAYLLTFTYAKNSAAPHLLNILHFTISLASPVASPLRAALVSVNLFNLLCAGQGVFSTSSLGTIGKFGGPILYLIGYSLVLFGILVLVDSGGLSRLLSFRKHLPHSKPDASTAPADDVVAETQAVENSEDPLRVLHVSKSFDHGLPPAVDDVTFGVSEDTVFAMLGPNGAGKTTTFNIIRGEVTPDAGEVIVKGFGLGVCPQFTAIDSQLTVREHLEIYGRLKGLRGGAELAQNVDTIIHATTLTPYADRLAGKLSGGNGRKLALAIALMGNPSVVLIDEFSTGIDAATKRNMWDTFRKVSVGKAVVITTHSMEEASALSNKVGILARKMLAVGTTESLAARFPIYEVHISCRTPADVSRAQQLMSHIPGARMAEDVATRFEVPLDNRLSLAELFNILSTQGDFAEYTVERVSLESVFLKVIRAHNILEEDILRRKRGLHWLRCC